MSFDKFAQLEESIKAYGTHVATSGKDDPSTTIAHLMCLELLRDLKAERAAAANYPGMVVRIDYKGRHIAVSFTQQAIDSAQEPIGAVAYSVRGAIAEVLKT